VKVDSYLSSNTGDIKQLFTSVFTDSEGTSEGVLIGQLVHDIVTLTHKEDLHGYVAIDNDKIIGCLFFTRLSFQQGLSAFLLSPMAIQTNYQGKGFGQQLINAALEELKKQGVHLVFTYGDPAFYSKVGFRQITEKTAKAPFILSQPEGWLAQSLLGEDIKPLPDQPYCVEAFNKPDLW